MVADPRTLHPHQGTTYRATFTWTTGDPIPVPVDLAGMTATFSLFRRTGQVTPMLAVSSAAGFTALTGGVQVEPGGVAGVVRVTLTAAQTTLMVRARAYLLRVSPVGVAEPVEYVASGPVAMVLLGA